jgi:hypothetical protein
MDATTHGHKFCENDPNHLQVGFVERRHQYWLGPWQTQLMFPSQTLFVMLLYIVFHVPIHLHTNVALWNQTLSHHSMINLYR